MFAAIGVGLTFRTAPLWTAVGADLEPFTKLIGAIAMTTVSAIVIADEATEYYQQMKKAEQLEGLISGGAEHKKGARASTKSKHQKGQANKKKARGGEKGESLPPRKRPDNWRGSWPPKK